MIVVQVEQPKEGARAKLLARLLLIQIFSIIVLQDSLQSALLDYDRAIASSSFGEPVFRLQPPNVIHYSNNEGTTLVCLASGSPKATISWYSSPSGLDVGQLSALSGDNILNDINSRPVTNITNLRTILQDGAAVRLLPFEENQFRQDVHSAEYRCVASNPVATIHSKSVSVRAVIQPRAHTEPASSGPGSSLTAAPDQQQQQQQSDQLQQSQRNEDDPKSVRVHDEFVQLKTVVVLKCKLQSSLSLGGAAASGQSSWAQAQPSAASESAAADRQRNQQLAFEWFTSDGLQVSGAEFPAKANKFVAFDSGELHVNGVDMGDLRRTYGCRVRNSTSRRLVASSNMARLILMDSQQQQQQPPVQVLHSLEQVIVMDQSDQLAANAMDSADQPTAFNTRHGQRTGQWTGRPRHTNRSVSSASSSTPLLLLLPCAIRRASSADSRRGQWFFQPSASLSNRHLAVVSSEVGDLNGDESGRQVALEQLVQHNRHWLQLTTLSGDSDQQMTNQNLSQTSPQASRLIVGPSYLAIERPRRQLTGRFIYQQADGDQGELRTVCDINVIVRQPIRLQMRLASASTNLDWAPPHSERELLPVSSARRYQLAGDESEQNRWASSSPFVWLTNWFEGATNENGDRNRLQRRSSDFSVGRGDGFDRRIRLFGPGRVPQTPVVQLGERLELNCLIAGHPIDSISWFRQGQAVNVQSSTDFQTEITNHQAPGPVNGSSSSSAGLISRLLIRQLQPRHLGLQMFECFAGNSLGDRARASLAVYVAERDQLEGARSGCPLDQALAGDEPNNFVSWFADEHQNTDDNKQHELNSLAGHLNPFKWALVLEGEPVELQCPSGALSQTFSAAERGRHQTDWFKWNGARGTDLASWLTKWRSQQSSGASQTDKLSNDPALLMATSSGWTSQSQSQTAPVHNRQLVASQFSQLFGGDSRFVMNGSSLQIRSPSKRHDETLFVCLIRQRHNKQTLAAAAATGPASGAAGQQPHSLHQSSSGQYRARASDCLESLFSLADEPNMNSAGNELQQLHDDHQERDLLAPLVSSISIRLVAKPKIDPFEFSRSLEEGMRTVVVCTVVSGQSLVDINWFKDGQLLVAEDRESSGVSIDFANGFSSSLTFHRIRPNHSGQYTCIASNALAAVEHSSRLLVNVAPYFIEPPKSQRVYLNSNVLINCRADGQPSPQIRWRKLVPVGNSGQGIASETPKGLIGSGSGSLPTRLVESVAPPGGEPFEDFSSILASSQQMALVSSGMGPQGNIQLAPQTNSAQTPGVQAKQEFRIITSNSHIQILENGSMIIREVELADAARYSCQASNGVQPILSEAIDLQVLVPAQFDVTYETVSVKRDSLVKLNCVPRGDQPMQIRWFKEGVKLARQQPIDRQPEQQQQASSRPLKPATSGKYAELLHFLPEDGLEATTATSRHHHHQLARSPDRSQQSSFELAAAGGNRNSSAATITRHHQLVLLGQRRPSDQLVSNRSVSDGGAHELLWPQENSKSAKSDRTSNKQNDAADSIGGESAALGEEAPGGGRANSIVRSELVINSADRSDSGLFVCLASNPFGKDELTYRLIVQELPDAPFNLQLQSVLSTSLKLMWQTPFDGNSPINYFVIEYRKLAQGPSQIAPSTPTIAATQSASTGPEWLRVIVNSNPVQQLQGQEQALVAGQSKQQTLVPSLTPAGLTNVVTLKQLAPKSAYQIRVAAVNSIGQGLFSPIQVISTAEEAPQTRPAEFRAQPIGSSAIKVSWRGPVPRSQDEAPVRGYYVSHRRSPPPPPTGSSGEVERASSEPNSNLSGWLATVSVSSSNYSTQSGDSNLLLMAINSNEPQPNALKGQQQQQQLVVYEFLLQMLDRNTKYDVRVQPFNSMGVGPAAELTVQTLSFDRPRQPVVKLVEARKQSLELKWSVPGFLLGPATTKVASVATGANSNSNQQDKMLTKSSDVELLGFSLYYKCEFDDWQEVQLALIFHYVIENLRCGNKYQIYLSAYNSVGRSDPSDVMSIRTEGTVPLAPDKSVFFEVNTTEATLNMASWSSGGCPISSFMVQYKRLNDKNWFILSEAADQRSDKIVVPDLAPATWYKLLVTAQNEAGTTNAEYIFGTLTRDGQLMTPPNYLMEQQQIQQPVRAFSSLLNSLVHFISGGGGNGSTSQPLAPHSAQQADGQLLFPLSCVLLLLVTSLASYLYYSTTLIRSNNSNKSSSSSAHHQADDTKSSSKCLHHHQNSHQRHSSSRPSEHTMQLFDGHLLRASSHSCLNGLEGVADSTASSSGSSSQAGGGLLSQRQQSMASKTLTLRHHNRHAQQLFQSMLLSDSAASKSQLLASDDQQQQLNNSNTFLQRHQQFDQSSPQSASYDQAPNLEHGQPEPDEATALTNYVLDSFLGSQQQAPVSMGGNTIRQPAAMGGTCRAATMKLFTNHNNQQPLGASCFDGAASSSLSSSGLGYSTNTHTSNGPHHDELAFGHNQQQHLQHQQPPPPPNGYDLDCDQMLDQLQQQQSGGGGHLTNHINLIQQQDDTQQQHYHFAPMQQVYASEHQQPIQTTSGLRLLSSSSFASAADLLQRQQHHNEPVYQRLDRFKGAACGLSNCATLNPQQAYKMKQHLLNANQQQQFALDNSTNPSFMTLGEAAPNPIESNLNALANEYQHLACGSTGHDEACLETGGSGGDQEGKCNQERYNLNCK